MDADVLATKDFDSVASAVYDAIDEDSSSQKMNLETSQSNLETEPDDMDDEEMRQYAKTYTTANFEADDAEMMDGDADDNEEEEEEDDDDYDQVDDIDELLAAAQEDDNSEVDFQHNLNANYAKEKTKPLIEQDKSGLIKRIKIPVKPRQSLIQKAEANRPVKVTKLVALSNDKTAQRSSTPLSREYLALQKSVNDSKILTEFVTDAYVEKTRKVRTKEATSTPSTPSTPTTSADHSYSSRRRSNASSLISPEKELDTQQIKQAKHHRKRFAPLRDEEWNISAEALTMRSRSKSMHNSDGERSSSPILKKWPSEEHAISFDAASGVRRANMRSENSEFVQKQKDFLQHVINSTQDTPQRRSRSSSRGLEVGTSHKLNKSKERIVKRITNESDGDDDKVTSQHRSRSRSPANTSGSESIKHKLKLSRRSKATADADDIFKPLECSTTSEIADNISLNHSNNSSIDVSTTTPDNVEHLETNLKRVWQPPPKPGSDSFCWKCHECTVNLTCSKCIRSFHTSCVKHKVDNTWVCTECSTVDNILNSIKRSRRNELSLELLSQLLAFALKRMRYAKGHYSFTMPYEGTSHYNKLLINRVTFNTMQEKIDAKEYRCAEELAIDAKWLLHNAYILSSRNSTKTVLATKAIVKICRQEVTEIETCAECYLNANTRTDWFVDVCSQPHLLLWAKLKGFPYWPAKAMGFGQNSVNVRFFGQHDRAFVSVKDCYLYSVQDPNAQTGKKAARELADCMKEVEVHIEKIINKIGAFNYAPFKTAYDPSAEINQLEAMMPGVQEYIRKQQGLIVKPPLQFKIYKTADNHLSIVQKASSTQDLSLPQQQQQQQQLHEADDLNSSTKKRKVEDVKKSEELLLPLPLATPKYEVISKVSSEDSNSSKLSTVILKRKSANGEAKRAADDEIHELPLPKMQKIGEMHAENSNNMNLHIEKRKSNTSLVDKSNVKHSKQDMKVPVITIKTSTTHKDINIMANKAVKTVTREVKEAAAKEVIAQQNQMQLQNEKNTAAQKVVENLVKNKQGVTIKKILKDTPSPNSIVGSISNFAANAILNSSTPAISAASTTTSTTTTQQKAIIEASKDIAANSTTTKKNAEKTTELSPKVPVNSTDEKNREEQKVTNILKGLVPFVEVKKEILSDNEDETTPNTSKETVSSKDTPQETATVKTPQNTTSTAKEANPNCKTMEKESVEASVLLTHVKEEVFSDDENLAEQSATQLSKQMSSLNPTDKTTNVNKTNKVRLVGDTAIQKVTMKIPIQPLGNKRNVLKGIPYGPLPATAFPHKTVGTDCLELDNANSITPRAKKSFPQNSPIAQNNKSMSSANANTTSLVAATTSSSIVNSTNQHNIESNKRSMAKTTMVAIPVDVAATTRSSANSLGPMMTSIPVPPLTAVSKTIPATQVYNSVARNAIATVTVSGTSGSVTTPTAMAIKSSAPTASISTATLSSVSSTSSVMARNSPITVASISSSSNVLITSPSAATTTSAAAATHGISMTAPPPLAGLSVVNIPSTGSGVNSGSLVTPALASFITDTMCRGLPKLAPRPSGPLQSEGYPMYPSQAGPVCKRLVDNAHKLTDFFISVMEDTMGEMAQGDDASLQAKITLASIELERTKSACDQQLAEQKRNFDLVLTEMRKSLETEKSRLVNETRKQCELEWHQRELDWKRIIEETKRKQWCAQCGREANFYCCWNTSYCHYPCQQLHWSKHAGNCENPKLNATDTTNVNIAAASNMTHSLNVTQERHHGTKLSNNCSTSLISPANVNAKSSPISHLKKEKSLTKNTSANYAMSSAAAPVAGPSSSSSSSTTTSRSNNAAEVLKLPSNTYLRPVASTQSNQPIRCNTTYSIPVQRFNVPLPITTPANTNGPQTFTIVHQGNGWVMSSGNAANNANAANPTIAAPIANVPQIQQHRVGGCVMPNSKSAKTQIRYH